MRAVFIFFPLISAWVSAQNISRWYEVEGGHWKVMPSLVQEALPLLQLATNKESERRRIQAPNLQSYILQYQGIVAKRQGAIHDDARSVFIRGACEIPEDSIPSLSGKWYLESDGSGCNFGAFYDPTSKQLTVFSFE